MRQTAPAFVPGRLAALFIVLAALIPAGLSGCGTADKENVAWNMNEGDPLSRPVQVAWTSARASRCGFIFEPAQLRANYLAQMQRLGTPAAEMRRIQEAYDYTYESVAETAKAQSGYCTKSKTDAIRKDLNQYLAGNFAHRASPAD